MQDDANDYEWSVTIILELLKFCFVCVCVS